MKPTSESGVHPSPSTIARRSFMWKAGAAVSATLASAAAAATGGTSRRAADAPGNAKEQLERLSHRLGILEDTNALRGLHRAFAHALSERRYEEAVSQFATDAEVHFDGGVFVGRDRGIRRLYVGRFGESRPEKTDGPVHVRLLDLAGREDVVEVAPDRQSATARFHCLAQAQVAVDSTLPIVEMARLQGQGVRQWWERGVFANAYVKEGDVWKIKQLRYRALAPADPVPGGA
jgi:SnoaL-like domain